MKVPKMVLRGRTIDLVVSFPWLTGALIRIEAIQHGNVIEVFEKPIDEETRRKYNHFLGPATLFMAGLLDDARDA